MNYRPGSVVRLLNLLVQVALAAILFIVFLLVVLRYGFHSTIIGGNEATLVAFVYVSLIAAAIALRDDEHIAVRYFTEKLPRRSRQVLAVVRWFLLAAINLLLFVFAVIWIRQTGDFLMPAMGLPQWIAQISVPLGCGLGFAYSVRQVVDAVTTVRGGT